MQTPPNQFFLDHMENEKRRLLREAMDVDLQIAGYPIVTGGPKNCWCLTCWPMDMIGDPSSVRMALCPDCGNKRCPRANCCENACTGSNEIGQPGSSWEHVKPFPKPFPGTTAGTAAPAVSGATDTRSRTMSKFNLRQAARCKVTGRIGFVHGVLETAGDETKCNFLHIDDGGNRKLAWVPESHLDALPPGVVPPFPNPYSTIGNEDTPPGGPGGATIAPGGIRA